MLLIDFKKYDITNFSPKEIEATGSNLTDVNIDTLIAIQKFRTYIRRPVYLIKNGITTGKHTALAHADGYAVDFYLNPKDGPITIHQIYKGCLWAGFMAFGIYWNQTQFSFHGEVINPYRKDYSRWIGVKNKKFPDWQWFSLLRDPKQIILE